MNARISEPAANRGLRVLVVEDEADALATTLALVEALGHSGGGLSNAELALDRFMDGAFDVIITDVGLPGLSGRDLAEILGGMATVPIIFATGQPEPAILPPRRIWLRKPFTLEQMADAITRAVATNLPEPVPSPQPSPGCESPDYGSLRAA